jgi:hypothetical protein
VRAWHPSLAPLAGDPFVEVRDPARTVEFTLVDRPSLTFTIVRPDGAKLRARGPVHERLAVALDREDGDRVNLDALPPTLRRGDRGREARGNPGRPLDRLPDPG